MTVLGVKHFDGSEKAASYFVAYGFARTGQGVVDLVWSTSACSPDRETSCSMATHMVESIVMAPPAARGLRSTQLRSAAAQGRIVQKAHVELQRFLDDHRNSFLVEFLPDGPPRIRTREGSKSVEELAAFAVRYERQLREGSSKAKIAKTEGVTARTLENWLDRAWEYGLWARAGRGRIGQATPLAYELTQSREGED